MSNPNHVTILGGLQATSISTATAAPFTGRGMSGAVHYEVIPGAFLHVILSPAGVTLKHGDAMLLFPLNELTALAFEKDPRIRPEAMKEIKTPPPISPNIVPLKNT